MKKYFDIIFFCGTVAFVLLLCDLVTPILYRNIETDHYRSIVLLDEINRQDFRPDLMVFGSSKAMSGIDANLLTEKLGVECVNFSSSNQSQEESSLFFPLIPNSVKTVVQIIFPPLNIVSHKEVNTTNTLSNNISTAFVFGGYKLTYDIKRMNPSINFYNFEKNQILVNYDARGSLLIPGLYNMIRDKNDSGTYDFKYPYSYNTEKLSAYDASIRAAQKNLYNGNDIEWDIEKIEMLSRHCDYLKSKGINMVIVMMPSNPDLHEFSSDQLQWIDETFSKQLPAALCLNYLNKIKCNDCFFDAVHLNKKGGKIATELLSKDIKKIIK